MRDGLIYRRRRQARAAGGAAATTCTGPITTGNGAVRSAATDRRLFEKVCLEGFQSGLSWLTILRKRGNFRAAFDGFDFRKVAGYGAADVARLLGDAGIVRHRGKIEATINNACQSDRTGRRKPAPLPRISGATKRRPKTGPPGWTGPRLPAWAQTDMSQGAQQGSEDARLEIRRPDDLLRLHAGHGAGQRPPRRLRLPRGDRG